MPEKTRTQELSENLIRAFVQFRRIGMGKNDMMDKMERPHAGLRHSEMMLLMELKELEGEYPDGISITDISRRLRVKPPSITFVVGSLEKKEMLERVMDENDRRIVRVRLREAGQAFIEKSRKHMISYVKGLVEYLGDEKCETLVNLINECYEYSSSHSFCKP